MQRFTRLITQVLNQVLTPPVLEADLEIPPDPKMGDFAFPCFKLSQKYKKSPPQIAQQLVQEIQAQGALPEGLQIVAAGPYVNFTLPYQQVSEALLESILTESYGQLAANTRGCWVLEYSSPNVAKPFQIYHLRPTALGAALDRIGKYRGFHVISINHLGDWGTQYGKLAVAFKIFEKDLPPQPTIQDMVNIYVKFHALAEKQPELPKLEDEARQAFLKLEQGDPEMTALWKRCVEIALQEFLKLYDRLNVRFDHIWGESYYKDLLLPLLEDLRKRNLLILSEGAWVVPVMSREGKELPPCILEKKDGATIYATRDVAAAIYRYEQFHFNRMTYIVGAEQKLHFQQVFGVLRKMGLKWESSCEHVPTGLYRFKDAKMSTRKGNFVTLESVLKLATERVRRLMVQRAQTQEAALPEDLESIVEAIAVGAVVFHDLHTDPSRDVDFDLERVVDFEGETGPYLQYAHTRCLSILRKSKEKVHYQKNLIPYLSDPHEMTLIKILGQFPMHLERTLQFAKASQLAHYLIDVVKIFGVFYRECRVLGESPEITSARLMLVEATRRVLAQGLTLLGIPIPERM